MPTVDRWTAANRLGGLRRFAFAITVLNIVGHTFLGFEPSWAAPFVSVGCAYATEILLESVDAFAHHRKPRFLGKGMAPIDFLLSAHISGLAVAMLLYANQRLAPIAFAAIAAIASKSLARATIDGHKRHLFNPSNLGIALTLLLFPSVGIAPPYMFTENLFEVGDWVFPGVIVCLGTFLNARFTHRLPLIATWVTCFAAQGWLRHTFLGATLTATFMPMTGIAFLLFTFYMVTDPATTPENPRAQMLFGACVAATYGLLMTLHVVFGLFFALAITSSLRGLVVAVRAWKPAGVRMRESQEESIVELIPVPAASTDRASSPASNGVHVPAPISAGLDDSPTRATTATAQAELEV